MVDIDTFIEKYRPDWERLDAATRSGGRRITSLTGPELDDMVRLYLRVSGHLAEAQSRYHDPSLLSYLTSLVARSRGAVYGSGAASGRAAARLFTVRYREAVHRTAPFILVSAVVFLGLGSAAILWVANSPEARAGLIPPQVHEAIRRFGGEPADFELGPAAVSTMILVNNIRVAILGFAAGIAFGVGTLVVLTFNAVYLGVIAGAFVAAGRGTPFWSLVLPHGLLELTAIFIACGAGFRMGWALVAPGDRRRSEALTAAAAQAVLVIIGVVPAFIVAGLIEGFVTGSGAPAWVQLGIGTAAWGAYVAFLFWPQRRYSRP